MGRLRLFLWALLSGVLFGLSQPLVIGAISERPLDPTGLSGLLVFVCFVPLLVLMKEGGPKRAYWLAFPALLLGNTIVLYWLVVAMTVFGHIPLPVSVLALLLLTSVMGFWLATPFAVTRLLCRRFALPQWAVFPLAFTASEMLRNYGPHGGFPWGTPGMSLATVPLLLQGASLVGVYGLAFVIGLVNAALAELVIAWRRGEPLPRRPLALAGGVLLAFVSWGAFRLATEPTDAPTVRVALLQGNIEQGIKNEGAQNAAFILERYHRLQDEALAKGADVVVWPEAALPRGVRGESTHLRSAGVAPSSDKARWPKAAIVGSVVWEQKEGAPPKKRSSFRSYNAALVTGQDLEVVGRFDKAHLVPFGEYVPWPLNAAVRALVPGVGTTPGGPHVTHELVVGERRVPVGTTICYEGIFPEISREFAAEGAQLMVNVTNDAWYGVSSAATQHLMFYAMRAAETGRAVARAANTGISAWVDTRGRVHDATRLYTEAVVVADVPLNDETTPYMVLREWVALPATLLAVGAWLYALVGAGFWRRRRHPVERAVGVLGLALAAIAVLTYYGVDGLRGDEAAANRAAAGTIAALLVGAGALSGRPWGRKAQLWIGSLAALLCGAGAVFGSLAALPVAVLGAVTAGLAWRRKHAYVREADPPRERAAGREA